MTTRRSSDLTVVIVRFIVFRFASLSFDVRNGHPNDDVVDTWIEGNSAVSADTNGVFHIVHYWAKVAIIGGTICR